MVSPAEFAAGAPPAGARPRKKTEKRKRPLTVDPNIVTVQQFLLDVTGRNVIRSRTGRPDGSWGKGSNQALINLVNDYSRNPGKYAGKAEEPILKEFQENRQNLSAEPEETLRSMNWFANTIKAGGEIKAEEVRGKRPIRDVRIEFRGMPLVFPLFDAVRDATLRNLNLVITNKVVLPWMHSQGMKLPKTWAELDKTLMARATAEVLSEVEKYMTGLPDYDEDLQLQHAMSVINERFLNLAERYNRAAEEAGQVRGKKPTTDIRGAILKDLAFTFSRVEQFPGLKERMLDRAAWLMYQKGAADEAGNIKSWELYNGTLGQVNREMMDWVEHFRGKEHLFRTQEQKERARKTLEQAQRLPRPSSTLPPGLMQRVRPPSPPAKTPRVPRVPGVPTGQPSGLEESLRKARERARGAGQLPPLREREIISL